MSQESKSLSVAQQYADAMIRMDDRAIRDIEDKHGVYGYPPELVSMVLAGVDAAAERDAALVKLAELEKQEPVAWLAVVPSVDLRTVTLSEKISNGIVKGWLELGHDDGSVEPLYRQPRPAAVAIPEHDYSIFIGWLIDKCEGQTIAEEQLQSELAAMLEDEHYGALFRREKEPHESVREFARLNAAAQVPQSAPGERGAFEAWVRRDWPSAPLQYVRDALPKNDPRYGEYCDERLQRALVGFQAGASWQRAQSAPAGVQVPVSETLADRFLSWKLPDSVRPDPCVMNPEYPYRYGTNLLTWAQAKEMFEFVLAAAPQPAPQQMPEEVARWLVVNIGCIECGVSSDIVGIYASKEEAQRIADICDEQLSWREGGQNAFEVFDLQAQQADEYRAALSAQSNERKG